MLRLAALALVVVGWVPFFVVAADGPVGSSPPDYPDHTRLLVVRDADGRDRDVKTPDDWRVRREHVLAHARRVMGPVPGPERRVPLDPTVLEEHAEGTFTRYKITLAVEPGDRLTAWLLVPGPDVAPPIDPIAAGKRPAVLALHQTVAIGKDEPVGLGGRATLRYGRELAERGYIVLAPDYPGFGESKTDAYRLGYASAVMKSVWNSMRAVDYLRSRVDVDPERIAAIGHSLGGHTAIFAAVFDDRIRAVVSSCGFNSFRFYNGGDLTGWSHRGYMPRIAAEYGRDAARVPFDFPELIGALAPRWVFVNAPLHDANFPVEGVRVCEGAAREVYRLLNADDKRLVFDYPDAPHDFPDEQRGRAYAFLEAALADP